MKRVLSFLSMVLISASCAAQTNVPISSLPRVGPLTGDEFFPVVQGGVTKRAAINDQLPIFTGRYTELAGLTASNTAAATTNRSVINNAIQISASLGGGTIYLPCGTYYVNGTITNNVQNVLLKGCTPSYSAVQPTGSGFTPAETDGTTIKATGSTFSPLYQHITPSLSTTPIFSGGGIENVTLDGNALVAVPLYVFDVQRGVYRARILGATSVGAKFQAGTNATDCKATCLIQFAKADLEVDTQGTAATAVMLTGTAASNVAFSEFNIRTLMGTGVGLDCVNADNNRLAYVAQITNGGKDVIARGQTASQSPGCSFNNFVNIAGYTVAANPIYAEGTDTPGVITGATNVIHNLDTSNLTPAPTAGTGASWDYYDEYEWHQTNVNIGYKFKLSQRTVGTLPACDGTTSGWQFVVTDEDAQALERGVVGGGGTHRVIVTCDNGSSVWRPSAYANTSGATSYTPTLGCTSGALGAGNSVTGNVSYNGYLATFSVLVTLGGAGIGTCAGGLTVTLPAQAAATAWIAPGQNVTTGAGLVGLIGGNETKVAIKTYNNAFPIGNSETLVVSGTYSTQ